MRKLGSIEKTEDFILAVAGGADINGTWRGSPLVEHYFTESMRHIVVYPAGHPNEHPDTDMEKLHVLIQAGADISPLFSSANEYYEYGNLIRLIVRRMKLLNVVLDSRQAQSMTMQNPACRSDVLSLHAVMDELTEKLAAMGL
ncbi:MAG: hypothetical protein ACI4LQ_00045 [Anaerovoracaceae bacterium]